MPAANAIAAPLTEVTSEVTYELLDPNGAQISWRSLSKLQGDQCASELHFVECGTLSLKQKLIINLKIYHMESCGNMVQMRREI